MSELPPGIEESIDRAAVNAKLEQMVEAMPCPQCGEKALSISWRIVAKPLGSYSLSGSTLKFSANEIPVVRCASCDLEVEGNLSRDEQG